MNNYIIKGRYGKVIITANAVAKVFYNFAEENKDKFIITNSKGKAPSIVSKIGGVNQLSNIDVSFVNKTDKEQGANISTNIIVDDGQNVGKIIDETTQAIDEKLINLMGVPAHSYTINIVGTIGGILSKRGV